MVAPFLPDEEKVAAIRAELVATGAGIYLDAATAGPLPAETDRAMREWSDWELRIGRAGPDADEEFRARFDEARGTLAAILVAPAERVGLAPGPGPAMRLAAEARRWRPGERIVAAGSLAPAVHASLGRLAGAVGAEVRTVAAAGGDDPALVARRVAESMEGGAALAVVPHVSPLDGSLLPVAELAGVAHRQGAWLAVDGSLAAGAIPIDVAALGADVYVAAGDRWLLGPSGVAAVYVGPAPGDLHPPSLGGEPAAFPADEFHRAAVIGLGRSAGWLAMQVGLDWAFARARHLLGLAAQRLGAIAGLTLVAPLERVGTVLAFRVAGWPAAQLREELGRRAFAVVGVVESADAIRLSVGCWNSEAEIGRFAEAVSELAATTPDRLPRRPPIAVVPADRP